MTTEANWVVATATSSARNAVRDDLSYAIDRETWGDTWVVVNNTLGVVRRASVEIALSEAVKAAIKEVIS